MGDLATWIVIAGMALMVVCLFSLSSQLQRNLHFILQVLDSNHKAVLERLDRVAKAPATAHTTSWQGMERRAAQRRTPVAQLTAQNHAEDRRRSAGRRKEDFVQAHAAGLFSSFAADQ